MPVAHQNTATRTPLFSRHQPGGTYAYAPIRRFPGEVFFVDSTDTTRGPTTPATAAAQRRRS